jgi:hypothetical protein
VIYTCLLLTNHVYIRLYYKHRGTPFQTPHTCLIFQRVWKGVPLYLYLNTNTTKTLLQTHLIFMFDYTVLYLNTQFYIWVHSFIFEYERLYLNTNTTKLYYKCNRSLCLITQFYIWIQIWLIFMFDHKVLYLNTKATYLLMISRNATDLLTMSGNATDLLTMSGNATDLLMMSGNVTNLYIWS